MSASGEEVAAVTTGRGPGGRLRSAREAKGVTVAAVTEALLVDARVIRALEADDYSVFDAPVYARGFLRKYATYLDLPAAEVIAAYDGLQGGPPDPTLIPTTTAAPMPPDLSKFRLPVTALAAIALVGGSYWWWLGHSTVHPAAATAPATATSVVPAPASASATAPVAAVAPAGAVDEGSAPLPEPASVTPDAGRGAAAPVAEPHPATLAPVPTPAVAAPAAATDPAATAPGPGITISAVRYCWVEVYGPSGARLFYDMVRAGDQRTVKGPGPWRIFLGNADGVQLHVGDQGVVVPPARRSGATARFLLRADGTVK